MSASLPLSPSRPVPGDALTLTSPLLRALMVCALFAVPVVVAVRPVSFPVNDADIWWHLRVGEWVTQHQAVPVNDPFSLPGQSQPWVAYSWVYEVLLCYLHGAFGLAGIIVYRVVFSLAIVAAIYALVLRLEKRFLVATGLTAAATLAVAMLFGERPWLFTILFSTLTLHAVVCLRRADSLPKWVWALPVLFVVWANVHIQFIYGLLLLALACAAPLIDGYLGRPKDETAATPWSRRWYQLAGLSAACFLATLVTPFHFRLFAVVVEYATQPGPFRYINELKALEFREPCDWVMLALTGTAFWALGRRQSSAFEVLLLVGAALLAFRARRDLWLVVLADLVVLASAGPSQVPAGQRFAFSVKDLAFVAVLLAGLAALSAVRHDLSAAGLQRCVEKVYPVEAARVVRERGYPGPLFNDFNWGGYFILALPELPVSIDGRTNLHGDERIERIGRTWAGLPGWQDDPDLASAGVVIAPADSPLAALLVHDTRFTRVHKDDIAWVYVRR
jgi:hypothetical protein